MPERVKRRYDSSRRRAQAEGTRRDILDAAQRLFESAGYATTTMDAIAAEAGVALKTVYVAFETKSGLLRALWNHLLRGGRDEVPIAGQDWYREVLAEPDPERRLRLNARNSRVVKERIAGVLEVIRGAAQVDPESAALWDRIQSEYHANQRAIVDGMAGALAIDVERAADILWALNHPAQWQLLVEQRGWSPDDYEQWCADTACAQLLSRGASSGGAASGRSRRGR
jgi:AcrR family transcriptional regulator